MELKTVIETLQSIQKRNFCHKELELVIPVFVGNTIGGRPYIDIESFNVGFDWDNGKVFLEGTETLRSIKTDEMAQIRKITEEYGWKVYENRNLTAEVKRLRQELTKLKEQNEKLQNPNS